MARQDRFIIAPLQGGLQLDVKPWLIPDDAFSQLENAYVFRGRVRKRYGARLMLPVTTPSPGYESLPSQLRIQIDTTDGSGNASGTVPGAIFTTGQLFSIGDQIYTCNALGTPATLLNTGSGTGTYNTTTGAYAFTGAAATTAVYFYPAQPVMGLVNYEAAAINAEPIYAFDTQFAYQFTSSGWARLGTAVWTGSNSDFFWAYNWIGSTAANTYLFVSNYHAGTTLSNSDTMKYWSGTAWTNFNPRFSSATATNTIVTARIIVPFKDRLVLLNVVENTGVAPGTNTTYVNRCRFSWNGSPVDSTAFYEDVPGKGGYIDAPTKEAIITAQFLYDRLIVYFERSTWELVYTGNQILPFVWQKINTELGAESTFSQVPFDRFVIGVGNVGIHACNGSNVERIDQKIPDSVFEVHNSNNGLERVAGIRDYFAEMVYWTFPSVTRTTNNPFNDRVLIYNYKTGAWAFNEDSITAFGYYQAATGISKTWAQAIETWQESQYKWSVAPLQAAFRSVIAGNQQGFVYILDVDKSSNDPSLQITDISISSGIATITCYNHNLVEGYAGEGNYIRILNVQGITGINNTTYPVNSIIDANTFTIIVPGASGTYTGGGIIKRVSNINIYTKQYNFYVNQGRNSSINKVDLLVDKTTSGQITVDYFASSSNMSLVSAGVSNGALMGSGTLLTSPYVIGSLENFQERLWHPVYPCVNGEAIQLRFYMTDEQLRDESIADSDFALHAMIFYTNPTSSRLE